MSVTTTIGINDKVTAAVDKMIKRIETMDARIARMDKSWSSVDKSIDAVTKEVQGFNAAQQAAINGAKKVEGAWGGIGTAIKGAMAFFGVQQVVGFLQNSIAGAIEENAATRQLAVSMANMGGTYEGFSGVKQTAGELQERTAYGDETYLAGAAEFSTYLSDPKAIQALLPTLGDYATGMSGGGAVNTQQMTDYATQLGKVFVGSYDGIKKKGFEVSEAQKKIFENGSDMEKAAVLSQIIGESWKGLAENMANTPEKKIAQMSNKFGDMQEVLGNMLIPAIANFFAVFAGNEATVQRTLDIIGSSSLFIIYLFTLGAETLMWCAEVFMDYGSIAVSVLGGIALAWLYAKTQAILTGVASLAAMTGTTTGALLGTAAVNCLSLSFTALKAAIAATGIGLIPIIIATIVVATMQWIESVGGISNAFDIVKIHAGLAFDWIMMKIDNAIDRLKAFWSGSKTAMIAAEQSIKDRESLYAEKEENGYARLNAMREKTEKKTFDPNKYLFDGKGGNNIDRVGEVGKIGKPIDINKEDIKLLRDVAEAKFVQNFVTLTPTVAMEVGTINENGDTNALLNRMAEKMVEVIEVNAQGVYG